jgi:hypothetical protein
VHDLEAAHAAAEARGEDMRWFNDTEAADNDQ